MNKLALLTQKFAVVDTAKAVADATGGSAGGFLRIKKGDPKTFIRFLPPLLGDTGTSGPPILPVRWHYIPSPSGKVKCVPCYDMRGRACPICEFDAECKERIGTTSGKSTRKEYSLPSCKYGASASQRYLAQVMMHRVNTDSGGFDMTGPHILEMPTMLMEKVFGIDWKAESKKAALTTKTDADIFDLNEGYWVEVAAMDAPTFFSVNIKSDRKGQFEIGPLFTDETDPLIDAVLTGMKDLAKLITWPEESIYTDGLAILRKELEEIAGDADDFEVRGEVVDARTVAARRKSAALPASTAASRLMDDDDDDGIGQPAAAPKRGARAAVQSFDMDDDI